MYNNTLLNSLAIFGAKYLFIFIIVIAFVYFLKQPRQKQKEMVAFGIMVLPIIYLLLKLAAMIYFDPRPFVTDHFTPLIPHEPDNGFPSDHAILSSAVASVVFPFSRKVSAGLWVLTVFVGISRVYTGIHHPLDIIASIVIAIIVATLVYKFLLLKLKNSNFYARLWHY